MVVDLTGAQDGMVFGANRSHALVRPPIPFFTVISQMSGLPDGFDTSANALPSKPVLIRSELWMPADQFNWSGNGPKSAVNGGSVWEHTYSSESFLPPPPSSGLRPDVVEADASNYFWAGILLGIAGGAFVALVQLTLAELWRKEDPPTGRPLSGASVV